MTHIKAGQKCLEQKVGKEQDTSLSNIDAGVGNYHRSGTESVNALSSFPSNSIIAFQQVSCLGHQSVEDSLAGSKSAHVPCALSLGLHSMMAHDPSLTRAFEALIHFFLAFAMKHTGSAGHNRHGM
jgi:hypothetical protein